jgi:uncharacterized protein (TIGR03086 family)
MDVVELHDRCVEEFLRLARGVAADRWDGPTPCTDWTVRELVNHLVYEERWAVPLMAGGTIESVGDRFDGDLLGDDPVAAAEHAARAAQGAAVEPVLAGRTVHLSFGDHPAEEYARQLAADHLIHAWDLAVATGQDSGLPADLVDNVAGWFADDREQGYRDGGWIADRPSSDHGDDPRARLLVRFGRDPRWSPALAAVEAFNAAFAAADVDAIMALMTEDCVFESTGPAPAGRRHEGAAAVREVWEELFAGTERPRFEWEDVEAYGERGVVRWRFGWDGGHVRGVDVLTLRGGKIAEKLSYVKG